MPHDGLYYLLFYTVIVAAGLPLVVLAEKVWGTNEGRDDGIWMAIALGGLALAAWLAS